MFRSRSRPSRSRFGLKIKSLSRLGLGPQRLVYIPAKKNRQNVEISPLPSLPLRVAKVGVSFRAE